MKTPRPFQKGECVDARRADRVVLMAGFAIYPLTALQTQQAPQGYIQGTVRSTAGPEAGVWVIAETKDLPTDFIKIVVTDDQGRYVLPELPTRRITAFGSEVMAWPTRSRSQQDRSTANNAPALNLTAVVAKDKVEAAKVYPGNYWMSMLEVSGKERIPARQRSQHRLKTGCTPSNRTAISAISSATGLPARWIMCSKRNPNSRPRRKPGTIA